MSTTTAPSLPHSRALTDVADIVSGFGFPKELQGKSKGDLPFFKVGDISIAWNSGQKNLTKAQHYLNSAEATAIRANAFPKGTVVFAKIGEAIRLNRRAILGQSSIVDNNVMGLIPKDGVVDSRYLFYWSLMLRLGDISQATTVPSVRKSDVEQLLFPWLPLDQQKLIVAEIEKQFSRLDEAVANLKRVKANIKRYKAAVLKAAVEGRLVETEAELARREGRSYETGEQLLQRILETRRREWKGKGKYKEPVAPDTTDLPELQEGWAWANVGSLGDVIGGLTKNPKRARLPMKLPYLRVANVYANELRLDEIEEIGVEEGELKKLLVLKNDLLIVEGNGSPEQIGRLAIWDGSINSCVHQNHLIKVRLSSECVPKWVLCWFMSPAGRTFIRDIASSTSGLYTLSVGKVSGLPVPHPPISEQNRIVMEIEHRLSLVEKIEVQVDADQRRAERLRQSILAAAFSGVLTGLSALPDSEAWVSGAA